MHICEGVLLGSTLGKELMVAGAAVSAAGTAIGLVKIDDERVLWEHTEDALIDSRALAMRDNRLFLYCPTSHLRSLNTETGDTVWTNSSYQTLNLIEQPGRGLTSTPGFRSACIAVAGPEALIIQGQTRMNVIAVSPKNGELLWQKKKITNNPNAIFAGVMLVVMTYGSVRLAFLQPQAGTVRVAGLTAVDFRAEQSELFQTMNRDWQAFRQLAAARYDPYFDQTIREAQAGAQSVF